MLGGQRADQVAAACLGGRRSVEGAFRRLDMGQISPAMYSRSVIICRSNETPFSTASHSAPERHSRPPAQHRVMVDDLPDLLGGAFVDDGHQGTSSY